MNTDNIYLIGKSHKNCQDYAYSDDKCIIVSDGCSSSPNSDIGARILTQCAKKAFYHFGPYVGYNQLGDAISFMARNIIDTIGLNKESLDSTLIIGFKFMDDRYYQVYVYGDGVVVFNKKDKIDINTIKFKDNTPYYLSYGSDKERFPIYSEYNSKNNLVINNVIIQNCILYKIKFCEKIEDLKSVIIATDGLSTFLDMDNFKFLNLDEVVNNFTSFKTIKDEFLNRRILKATERYRKENIYHMDDIALAGMIF